MPVNATIATAQDITLGQFARESQVSHLIGRVIRYVFDPTPDANFQAQQYSQLERALSALIPHLINEDREFGKYCTALGMCYRQVVNATLLCRLLIRTVHFSSYTNTASPRVLAPQISSGVYIPWSHCPPSLCNTHRPFLARVRMLTMARSRLMSRYRCTRLLSCSFVCGIRQAKGVIGKDCLR
jgi:hypothetical protein